MDPSQLLTRAKAIGAAFTTAQKISLAAAFVIVVVAVGGSAMWLQRPEYALLFADMDPEAAADVVSRLKNDKVPYELDPGGRSIRVPSARVDELRLQFSSEGLPSSGRIGFEIFDRTAFGATEFLEQVNYRRALEGEIARTIATLSEVSGARVHIAMSRRSLFASREQPAKASVVLKLRGNKPLPASTIQGIANLVAASVEGLGPDAVVIMDSFGRPLARPQPDDEGPLGGAQLERQQRIERDLTARVVALLEPVVGTEGVRVNVSATLDPSTEEATEEVWDPNAAVVRSRQVTGDFASSVTAQGLAGARANLPPPVTQGKPAAREDGGAGAAAPLSSASAAGPSGPKGRGTEITNYEISRLTRHTVRPRGAVQKLSVAVILDNETVITRNADGSTTRSTRPRPPEMLQKIQGLVAAAVGLDTERGDHLTVENVPFEEVPVEDVPPVSTWQRVVPQAYDAVRVLTPALLGLLALFFLVRPLVARAAGGVTAVTSEPVGPTPLPRTVEDLEGEIEAQLDAAVAERAAEHRKLPVLAKRLTALTTREPEHAARLIRMWMTEDGSGS